MAVKGFRTTGQTSEFLPSLTVPQAEHKRTFTRTEALCCGSGSMLATEVGLTLAAGALTAVDDGQHHGLLLTTVTLQAEEADGLVWVQAVATALTDGLQVRLLSQTARRRDEGGATSARATACVLHHDRPQNGWSS